MIARKSLFITTCWVLMVVHLSGQPSILIQPTDQFVSLNSTTKFTVSATTESPPLAYQWWFNDAAIDVLINPTATNSSLVLSNVTMAQAGSYWAVLSDTSGSVTSRVAQLIVDPTSFTKVTTGPPVTDLGCSFESGSWGDYDGDGYADLFVARYNVGHSALYRNNRDGTFTSITNVPFAKTADAESGVWADFDNDGRPDLFVAGYGKPSFFYFNNGDGTFSVRQLESTSPFSVSVADYNQDGLLDVFMAGFSGSGRLYRNNGDRTFTRMTSQEVGPLVSTAAFGGAAWADYDDDGMVEVYAANYGGSRNLIFQNDGTGRFLAVTNLVTQTQQSAIAGAWGDYDNDGKLDLCVGCLGAGSTVYRNLGNGQFEKANTGLALGGANSVSWVDYDNDGFQDLFFTYPNALYHNNGDGTFRRVTTGIVEKDTAIAGGVSMSGLWFDYDNDGFLDLYVFNGNDAATVHTANFLYHNNGNSNAWLKIKLIGTVSNRDGVGAKVRAMATYAGKSRWQRHDISAGDGLNGNHLYAHFGLGDATNVDLVRIEWPSGNVQELTDVTPNRLLTVKEAVKITPTNPSSSLNGSVTLTCTPAVTGTYQWQFNGVDLADQTNRTLNVTNIQANQEGRYSVVATTTEQAVTNYVYLHVDTLFTKITTGPGADRDNSLNCYWADYNKDGFIDLFVANGYSATRTCFLYRNNGDGTFTRMTTNEVGSIVGDLGAWRDAAWGDYDNDGFLELYVTQNGGKRALYHNTGDGRFTRITTNGPLVTDISFAEQASWGDYDNDGLLDLFVATGYSGNANSLYHNEGGGTFTKVTTGPIPRDIPTGDASISGAWVDFDNDGDLDLVVGGGNGNRMFVYRNNGNGQFEAIKTGVLAQDSCYMIYLSWGDYDNDGLLDLFLADWNGKCRLFHNDGNGNFTKILLTSGANYADVGCWGDYDNDGYLDLFISMGEWGAKNNQLYHNNGDGTFTQVITGSLVNDKGNWDGAAWGDYDNNGFLDMFVVDSKAGGNALYRNNGNSNHWVIFKLAGTASNRSAIGAKVRVKATTSGKTFWQMRQITGSFYDDLRAHFGLGNATKADVVRIEWPSGAVQELTDVPANQILSVWEPPVLSATVNPDSTCLLAITAEPNCAWRIQASTDLQTWQTLATVTNTIALFQYADANTSGMSCRFYRVVTP